MQERSPITRINPLYSIAKRLLDIGLGSILLVVSTPIILLAAIAICLDSKGNPFFVQTRLGLGCKPFRIFKLRGMYIDAKQRFPELYDYTKCNGLDFYFHHRHDPRITRVGAFTRLSSIDELPNFLNVVMGDMSLIGPRPEIPDVMALYGDEYMAKYLSVKPGVTCLSKISGRDRLTKEESIRFDLDYVDRMSFGLDVAILWTTFKSVVLRRNVCNGQDTSKSSDILVAADSDAD